MTTINSVETAIKALKNDDPGVRYHAVWWLGKNRAGSAVRHLIECLHDEGDQTSTGGYPLRRQAARSLGLIKDTSCTPYLLETLHTKDIHLHEATLRALIELKTADCKDELNKYVEKNIEDKPIEALIETLATYKMWNVKEKVEPYLHSGSERIASAAASYFYACTGEVTYLSKVHSYLSHSNRFIRQSAAFDLARIASIKSTESILKAKIPNNIKMHALKSILERSILYQNECMHAPFYNLNTNQQRIIEDLDNLIRENFAGNIVIDKAILPGRTSDNNQAKNGNICLSDTLNLLKSPSLEDRELGIHLLTNNNQFIHSDLSNLYFSESDQDIKVGLIKAMASTENPRFFTALLDAVGVEIGNHCQGNIRRIATCALGRMISKNHINKEAAQSIIEKLAWAITKPDDWGLRYSASLALEEISTNQSTELLTMASRLESDAVVLMRINLAKRKTVNL